LNDSDGEELGLKLSLGLRLGDVESEGTWDNEGAVLGIMVSITRYSRTLSFMLNDVPPGPSSMYTPDSAVPRPKGHTLSIPKNFTPSMIWM
jgi:hypothetical protein